jgi:hypothetical protein
MSFPHINNLVGLPLSVVRHAVDMLNLQFGEITREAGESWGQYALHIQAPWRLVKNSQILVGRSDRWNPTEEISDWDAWYEFPHPNREDSFWEKFMGGIDPVTNSFEGSRPSVIVESVVEHSTGDLSLRFSDSSTLEVFGCGTNNEFWRLLEPGRETNHYVVGTEK